VSDGGGAPAASRHLAEAQVLLDLRRPEAALAAAGRGLAADPGHVALLLTRAEALLDLGRLAEAHRAALDTVARAPLSCSAHTMMGRILLAEDDLPVARRALEHALALDPADRSARFLLVNCLSRQREPDRARALAQELVASGPDAASAHVAVAVAELGRVRQVRLPLPVLLLALLVTRGGVLVVLAVIAAVHRFRNRAPLRRADLALREALRLAPQDAVVLGLAAEVLSLRGDRLAAIDRRIRAARADAAVAVADAGRLATDLRRQQVLVELGLLVAVGLTWWPASAGGRLVGLAGLAASTSVAIGCAVLRRRRLRRIMPRGLWTSSVGRGWAAWLGPAVAAVATGAVVLALVVAPAWPPGGG